MSVYGCFQFVHIEVFRIVCLLCSFYVCVFWGVDACVGTVEQLQAHNLFLSLPFRSLSVTVCIEASQDKAFRTNHSLFHLLFGFFIMSRIPCTSPYQDVCLCSLDVRTLLNPAQYRDEHIYIQGGVYRII